MKNNISLRVSGGVHHHITLSPPKFRRMVNTVLGEEAC